MAETLTNGMVGWTRLLVFGSQQASAAAEYHGRALGTGGGVISGQVCVYIYIYIFIHIHIYMKCEKI